MPPKPNQRMTQRAQKTKKADKSKPSANPMTGLNAARTRTLRQGQSTFAKQTPAPAKRGLGATDSGETQRVGGLKAAGKKYTGTTGSGMARQTRSAVMSKKSSGSSKSTKR